MRPRLRARHCQFCCNIISKWRALVGVVNCNTCVYRMQYGGQVRCFGSGPHRHGQEVSK